MVAGFLGGAMIRSICRALVAVAVLLSADFIHSQAGPLPKVLIKSSGSGETALSTGAAINSGASLSGAGIGAGSGSQRSNASSFGGGSSTSGGMGGGSGASAATGSQFFRSQGQQQPVQQQQQPVQQQVQQQAVPMNGELSGGKEFTLKSGGGVQAQIPLESKVVMFGEWSPGGGYQIRLVVSGKMWLRGFDGEQYVENQVDTNCDTGIVTNTSTDDLGQVQGGPAECRFESTNGYIYMSAKIRTVSGKKTLMFNGYTHQTLDGNPPYHRGLFPMYKVELTSEPPAPVVITPGEKEFTIKSGAGNQEQIPLESYVKMTGKWSGGGGYQVRLVVSGKMGLYGFDGTQYVNNTVDTNCDTGIVTNTYTDDLGQVQGGPAECRFESTNGYIYMSAKIRTISGKKVLIFSGYKHQTLDVNSGPAYNRILFPMEQAGL
jgi:hypothetical protein